MGIKKHEIILTLSPKWTDEQRQKFSDMVIKPLYKQLAKGWISVTVEEKMEIERL